VRDDKKRQVTEQLRASVRFDRVNLNDDSKMLLLKGMDVIFCCNVLIYFDLASKRRAVQHFYANLLPHGYLFLGNAESRSMWTIRFDWSTSRELRRTANPQLPKAQTIGYAEPEKAYLAGLVHDLGILVNSLLFTAGFR
jgi:hypothetical protein